VVRRPRSSEFAQVDPELQIVYVRTRAHDSVRLVSKSSRKKVVRNDAWKVLVNADVEIDV
jgi:hypothetical protein